MLNKNVMTFIGCDAEYNESEIVLFGAPFDSTTSYRPGARFGSQAIRNESYGLETYSPYQGKDLTDYKIFDSGDLELPIGDTEKVLAEMLHDKKAQGGQITVIKVPGLGCWRAETIPVEGLRPLLGMED